MSTESILEGHESGTGGALDGVVVADFSRILAGPYCTMLLADMGATVIKVESPQGDDTRSWRPPTRGEESTFFLSINRNKRSIVLDLRNEEDRIIALRIAARADVFVENFKPGGLKKYGLDYAGVRELNPDVVYASISGFGSKGGAKLPGYDLLVQACSGLMSLTGSSDGPPMRAGVAVMDVITGLHTAIGITAALSHRSMGGGGQLIETNLMSSGLSGLVNQVGAYVLGGGVPHRMGNEHPSVYPYEPIPTADGDLVLAVGNDRQFAALCQALEADEILADDRFATVADRNRNRAELRPLLQAALSSRTAAEWFPVLTGLGVPSAPINTVAQGVEFAAELGLNPVVEVGDEGPVPGIANPISFSRTPVRYDLAPPKLGQHGGQVRAWLEESSERLR